VDQVAEDKVPEQQQAEEEQEDTENLIVLQHLALIQQVL
tara:strand:- start:543 stop:659 length:117 start_codon:yes stop_codon:yes gene_type:complete